MLQLKEGEDFQCGKSKLFVRKPETIFSLEEQRERHLSNFASKIQRFVQRFALQQKNYELLLDANNVVKGKKERRRLSIGRSFLSDYINLRENFELKDLVKQVNGSEEKIIFADTASQYNKRGKVFR